MMEEGAENLTVEVNRMDMYAEENLARVLYMDTEGGLEEGEGRRNGILMAQGSTGFLTQEAETGGTVDLSI